MDKVIELKRAWIELAQLGGSGNDAVRKILWDLEERLAKLEKDHRPPSE